MLLSNRKLVFSTFNTACLSPQACFATGWGDPDGLPFSDPESKDRIPKLFTDSRDERGVAVNATEWFGDPHDVQAHEKFGLSRAPDKSAYW